MSQQSSNITHSVLTAFVAVLPNEALSYAGKLLSVLVLAVVAELGRRSVSLIWKKGKGKDKENG